MSLALVPLRRRRPALLAARVFFSYSAALHSETELQSPVGRAGTPVAPHRALFRSSPVRHSSSLPPPSTSNTPPKLFFTGSATLIVTYFVPTAGLCTELRDTNRVTVAEDRRTSRWEIGQPMRQVALNEYQDLLQKKAVKYEALGILWARSPSLETPMALTKLSTVSTETSP